MGKHPDQALCEDVIAVTDAHAAVFDGAGGPASDRRAFPGRDSSPPGLAEAVPGLAPESNFAEAAAFLSAALDERMRDVIGDLKPSQRPCAVGAIYSAPRREIWRVGDLHCAVDSVASLGSLEIGRASADFRALYLRLLLLSGNRS